MQQSSVRFIITCAARTGSTMLVRTLRNHPQMIVHGEVWGERMTGLDGPLADTCGRDAAAFEALEQARFREPDRILHETFLHPHGAQAVGFKLKYDELVRPEWSQLRRQVEADTSIAIVFLHRRDLLRRYLSHQVVLQQTGITVIAAGETPPQVMPFTVDIDDMLRDIAETRRRTHEFEAAFAGHPSMQVVYEDLATDPQRECNRVFTFLGVKPSEVRVATERIVRQPLETLVRNFEEVRAALRTAGEG